MTNRGTVIRAGNGFADVLFERMSACAGCHSAESCGGMCGASKPHTAKARDPIGVSAGDIVEVTTSSSVILRDAALVFVLPALCAIILCGIVYILSLPSFAYYTAAALGLAIPFIVIKLTSERLSEKKPPSVITAVISKSAEKPAGEK